MYSISLYFQIITSFILLGHSVSEAKDCGPWPADWEPKEAEKPNRESFEKYRKREVYTYDIDGHLLLNAGFQRNPMITSSTVKLSFFEPDVTVFVEVCQPPESKCTPYSGNATLQLSIFGKNDFCKIDPATNPIGFMCRTAVWPLHVKPEENLLIQFAGVNDATNCKLTVKLFTEGMGLARCKIKWQKHFVRDYTGIPIGAQRDHKDTITITTVREDELTKEKRDQLDKGEKTDLDWQYKHGVDLNARLGISLGPLGGGGFKQSLGNDYTTSGSKEDNRRLSTIREKLNTIENQDTQTTTLTIHFATGLRYDVERLVIECGGFTYKLGDTMRIRGSDANGQTYENPSSVVNRTNSCAPPLPSSDNDDCESDDCDGVASLHCHVWLISIGVCFSIFIGLTARSLAS